MSTILFYLENLRNSSLARILLLSQKRHDKAKVYLSLKRLMTFLKINKWVVQEYIHNPFLIDGYKFDLRIYVLITRVEPLSIFIYKEGLARFATEKYNNARFNINDEKSSFIHLTNYAINKKNSKFSDTSKIYGVSNDGNCLL